MLIKNKQEILKFVITLYFLPLLQYHFCFHLFNCYLIKKNFRTKIWAVSLVKNFEQNFPVIQFQIIIDQIIDYFIGYLSRIVMIVLQNYFEKNNCYPYNWATYFECLNQKTFTNSFFINRIPII